MMAQGIAAGGQGIARGIEAVGQQAAAAIKEYQTNRLMSDQAIGEFTATLADYQRRGDQSFVTALQSSGDMSKLAAKLSKNGSLPLGDASKLATFTRTFSVAKQREEANQFEAMKALVDQQNAGTAVYRAKTERMGVDSEIGARGPGQFFTLNQVADAAKHGVDITGVPVVREGVLGVASKSASGMAQSRAYPSVEEQSAAKQDQIRTEGAYKFNEGLIDSGFKARQEIRGLDQAAKLLDTVETGFGQDAILKAKQIGRTLGVDVGDIKDAEQLRTFFGDAVMARVAQTKGAISDKEMSLFADYSANFKNTPDGNKAILGFAKQAAERSVQLSKMVRDMRGKGSNENDIQLAVEKFQDDNPLTIAPEKTPTASGKPQKIDSLVNRWRSK